jgi:hypothetical protein
MTLPRRRLRLLAATCLVLAAYPAFVLGTVYAQWFRADLPGGRNGPADAYRHSLASATVAYTTSPRVVAWVTAVMEGDGRRGPMSAMDAHNNRIGAAIGARARSWAQMQSDVLAAVRQGAVDATDPDRITWLPRERWLDRMY